jgi:hypothetical protein
MFLTLIVFNSPINTLSVFDALVDALELGMLKRLIFEQFEEDENIKSIQDFSERSGTIVFVGIPVMVLFSLIAILLIFGCKKFPKCQAFGMKIKDKLMFGMAVNLGIASSLRLSH